jgi:tRNA pseudouridine13 synthase
MAFNTNFIYAYGQPKASGTIKSEAEDFKVFEEPAFELSGSGEHTYLKIRKTNNNTAWVAGQLAEFADIDTKDVGFAGRKDRFAVTEQWFSCYLPGENNVQWEHLDIEGVSVLEVTKHSKKLRKGDLKGNAFELTVRNVTNQKSLDERLHKVQDSGVPNYFGEQRFGRENGNLVFADKLLKGSRSIRRNRDIYLSAARSYMFNHYLSTRIATDGWDTITGIDTGPLYGMSRDPRPGEELLPSECNQWCQGLQQLRVKTGARNLKLKPSKMRWRFTGGVDGPQGPQALQIAFSLPAGAFATSLLREVVDYSERDE